MNLASAAQPLFVSSAAAGEGGGAGVVYCRDLIIRDNVICRQAGEIHKLLLSVRHVLRVHRHAVPPAGCWRNGAESRHQN